MGAAMETASGAGMGAVLEAAGPLAEAGSAVAARRAATEGMGMAQGMAQGMAGAEGAPAAPGRRVPGLKDWTPGRQRRALLDLLRAGKTDVEIGARFALTQWQVRNLRYRLGIKKDRGGRLQGGTAARTALPGGAEAVDRGGQAVAQAPARQDAVARPEPVVQGRGGLGEGERMGVRIGGRFDAAEAGRRLTALGGLLGASTGRYELRVFVRQVGPELD